ncbi:hypothetical protein [Methylobacterium iners]|uniref:Uncharacterized protein n=1 Tax=Methylobacterium iners TaxID=418707 RepID=A0ABQ4RQ77_9HYPH|nr:hypothetical protein [Methylobacterium iners]GJD92915.1 hypothetical protein OCOJLMKI_0098 [Methylobacterium iners]
MPVLKHGDVVVIVGAVEVRSELTGQLDTVPTYRVVVEDRENATITLEPVSKGVLQAIAPEKYEAAVGELRAHRELNPIRTRHQLLKEIGAPQLESLADVEARNDARWAAALGGRPPQ